MVLGPTKLEAEAVSISFSTVSEPDPVPATEADASDLNKYTYVPGNGQKNSDGQWTTTFLP